MCSLSVKTLPWPMGAFGPRKTIFLFSKLFVLAEREEGWEAGREGGRGKRMVRTKIVWQAGHGAGHVRLGRLPRPEVLQVPVAADDGEPRAEARVEARGADDGVDPEDLARLELDALGHEPPDLGPPDLDVGLRQGAQVSVARRQPPRPQREVGNQRLAERLVALEHRRHVFRHLGSRKGLRRAVRENLTCMPRQPGQSPSGREIERQLTIRNVLFTSTSIFFTNSR